MIKMVLCFDHSVAATSTRARRDMLGLKPELISVHQTRPIRSTYLSEEVLRRLPCCLKRK